MKLKQVNVKDALFNQRKESNSLIEQAIAILNTSVQSDEDVLSRLKYKLDEPLMDTNLIDENDSKNIFNIHEIKSVCIKYNLRFLDSSLFKSEFPYEAIIKIKEFEKKYKVKIKNFKIVAPADVFKLEDCNKDPLLFAQLADNKYYLLHQWGSDLSWYRAIISFPARSIYSYFFFMWIPALIIAFALPFKWLYVNADYELSFRLWFATYTFVILFVFTLFLGSTTNKNFSENCWDSRYYNG